MYNKDQFIYYVRTSSCFRKLAVWVSRYSSGDNRAAIAERLKNKSMSSMGLYLEEAGKFYANLKCYPTDKMVVNEFGISVGSMVYDYKPLSAIPFLGVMYALNRTDIRDYHGEDKLKGDIIFEALSKIDSVAADALYGLMRDLHPLTEADFSEEKYEAIKQKDEMVKAQIIERMSIAGNQIEERVKDKPNSKHVKSTKVSNIYVPELHTDEIKRNAIECAIRETIYPAIKDTNGTRDDKWKWPHLQEALFRSKYILTKENKNAFGRAMEQVTGEPWNNVAQRFKGFSLKPTDENIITQMQACMADAIAQATKANDNKKSEKENTAAQDVINPILKQLLEPILLLEPYYYHDCTKEMVIEGFQSLTRKYVPDHFVDVEKRIRKTSFNFITALQEIRFIRGNVPALEMGFHLQPLYDDLQPMDICRGLMNSVDERLPESVNMLLTQFRFDMQHIMKNVGVVFDEVEEVETIAHRQYLEYLNAKEQNLIERLVHKTLCFSPFFQHYVKEQDVWDMYNRMFREITLVASVHRTFQETRIDTAVCKVVGVLREVKIIKDGVPVRQLAECFTSTSMHYESIRKAITIGFDRDRMLHDFIYDFWMRKYLPD